MAGDVRAADGAGERLRAVVARPSPREPRDAQHTWTQSMQRPTHARHRTTRRSTVDAP